MPSENNDVRATKVFPTILIALDLCASATYLYYGDFKHALYWFAAATLTACVTY